MIIFLPSISLQTPMSRFLNFSFLLYIVVFGVYGKGVLASRIKMCEGFKTCEVGGHSTNHVFNYNKLKSKFPGGCTHVLGNVVIQGLQAIKGSDPDLSFLDLIQEINGCLIVNDNSVQAISLKNLRIIRGYQSFEQTTKVGAKSQWAVFVSGNHRIERGRSTVTYPPALRHLDLRSLKSIQNYGVLFESNMHLCYPQFTVNWKDIFEKETQKIIIEQKRQPAFCPTTSTSCAAGCKAYGGKRYCWGPGADMCQTMNKCVKRSCALSNRCFIHPKTKEEECCDNQCVAGCTGSTARDCLACTSFLNDGECVKHCPPSRIYDPKKFERVINPNRRLAFGSFCVKSCSHGYYEMQDSCVASCDKANYIARGNKCERCTDRCPKSCKMDTLMAQARAKNPLIPKDISFTPRSVFQLMRNCTILEGNVVVNVMSVNDKFNPKLTATESVRPEDLWNMKNIKVYSGRLGLRLSSYPTVTNISFLSNLEIIRGYGLVLSSSNVRFLGLQNLKRMEADYLIIVRNHELCYLENFEKSVINVKGSIVLKTNKDLTACKKEGKVCSDACLPEKGCRGPGPFLCGECKVLKAGERCVANCTEQPGYFHDGVNTTKTKTCAKCHPECKMGCTGVGHNRCIGGCKHYKDGPNCVASCPRESKFANRSTGHCESCHSACFSKTFGKDTVCTGMNAFPGPGGCEFCKTIIVHEKKRVDRCVNTCPVGYYKRLLRVNEIDPIYAKFTKVDATKVCRPCHSECAVCSSAENYKCQRCRNFRHRDKCVPRCPADDTYNSTAADSAYRSVRSAETTAVTPTANSSAAPKPQCLPCHQLCRRGCSGPSQEQCRFCKKVKVYLNEEKTKWSCNESCPEHQPYEFRESNSGDSVCNVVSESAVASELRRRSIIIACVVLLVIIIIIVAIIIVCCVLRQRDVARKEQIRLKAKFSGALRDEERELLTMGDGRPTVPPDQSQLRIIRDSELVRGQIIGSGAFGTVYRCVWKPPPDPNDTLKVSLDVAVKLLSDSSDPKLNAEFLEEARVMASLNNDYVMPLIGVCMTAQLQLVSLFQPHGSLLDYLRRYQATIKSKALLTWAVQIAKGMEYLESKKIIHRDLAGRNVLVQDHNHVRITDFGLAKLMDSEDARFLATGGKMPVKWLALECIQQRIFTHKSDVWAFGITLWELFTFGQRPYGNMNAVQMCEFLQQGERLAQPEICTLDIYMLIIKCWMLDPESRPSFKELVDELMRMRNDPPRYLVIQKFRRLLQIGQGDDARNTTSVSSGSGTGNHQTLPTRPWRTSNPSDEDKASACSGASYASPSGVSVDGYRGGLGSVTTPDASCRHRHLTAAAAQRERERAKARYAEDPLSSSSPPRSTSAAEDDYLEPHNPAASAASQPWSAGYVNTTPFDATGTTPSRGAFPFSPGDASNPEYMNPSASDYLAPNNFESPSLPSAYYNEDVFMPPPPPPPAVGYQNFSPGVGGGLQEDTSV